MDREAPDFSPRRQRRFEWVPKHQSCFIHKTMWWNMPMNYSTSVIQYICLFICSCCVNVGFMFLLLYTYKLLYEVIWSFSSRSLWYSKSLKSLTHSWNKNICHITIDRGQIGIWYGSYLYQKKFTINSGLRRNWAESQHSNKWKLQHLETVVLIEKLSGGWRAKQT